MTDETGLLRPDRRVNSSGPRAVAAAVLSVAALVTAAGLAAPPAGAAGRMPAAGGGVAAVTPTGDPTDPPATPVATIVVGSVLHYRTVPVGYAATVIGTVDRPAGTTVTARLTRLRHNHWVTVAAQVIPASATAGRARATFPVSTATTRHRTFRVEASSSSGAATPGPQMTMTVVAARITKVHPAGDEFVTVKNSGTTAYDLRNWTLGTASLFITLPHRDLRPGQSVRVYTGPGTNTAHRLYVSRAGNLWHKHGGTVLLTAPHHVLIKSRTF
jgi:hypothetical protein